MNTGVRRRVASATVACSILWLGIVAGQPAFAQTTAYAFIKEEMFQYTGAEQVPTPPAGATHYESEALSGGGGGGSVPNTQAPVPSGAAAAGGGSGGISRNRLRAVTSSMSYYVARGGQKQTLSSTFDSTYNGLPGEETYIKENGVKVLRAQGALGGQGCPALPLFGATSDPQGVLHETGASTEPGSGGNHDEDAYLGDEIIPGASGHAGLLLGNIRLMGQGGNSMSTGGGKGDVFQGSGHGPGGGAMAYGGNGPFRGAIGAFGYVRVRWYVRLTL